ncbi:MAG: hypothetical protein PVI97_00345 [Candidatus Thiodiazotropha sp.]
MPPWAFDLQLAGLVLQYPQVAFYRLSLTVFGSFCSSLDRLASTASYDSPEPRDSLWRLSDLRRCCRDMPTGKGDEAPGVVQLKSGTLRRVFPSCLAYNMQSGSRLRIFCPARDSSKRFADKGVPPSICLNRVKVCERERVLLGENKTDARVALATGVSLYSIIVRSPC